MTSTDIPTSVDLWRALRGQALVDAIMVARWYAHHDDTIGGWAVTVVDAPPTFGGAPNVGSFLSREVAEHVVLLHNEHVQVAERRASGRARMAEIMAARPAILPGDVIDVPAGADWTVTTRHRVRVEGVSDYGASGYRIKADGTPMKSRSSITGTKDGYVAGLVPWSTVTKSTVYRDGQPIHTPEGTK